MGESMKNFIQEEERSVMFFLRATYYARSAQEALRAALTRLDDFARRVLHYDLTGIEVLERELEAAERLHEAYLVRHVQVVAVPLEHLGENSRHSSSRRSHTAMLCALNQPHNFHFTIQCQAPSPRPTFM